MKRITSAIMMLLALAAAFASPGMLKVDDGGRLWLNMGEGGYGYPAKYTEGWNELMDLIGVEGKDLTLEELCLNSYNPLNEGWHYTGFPFDEAVNIDKSGNSSACLCSLDGVEDMKACFVVNRPHMPSGNDAEVVWDFLRHYKRDTETGASTRLD